MKRDRYRRAKQRSRALRLESLEDRRLLAVGWRNPVHSLDVSADGLLSPVDVLQVVNELNAVGSHALAATRPAGEPYWDCSGDQFISPVDALQVINALNAGQTLPYTLAERQQIVAEQSITITVGLPMASGSAMGTRTYRLEVTAGFDRSDAAAASRDLFAIYLVDPQQPSQTLLDRGQPGTTLFTLSESGAEFAPGRVRWDGQIVELDLSELTDRDTAELRLQLLSNDGDRGSSVVVRPLSNEVDAAGTLGPRLLDTTASPIAGAALNLATLSAAADIAVQMENVRYDSTTRRYAAELRLHNAGESVGRNLAVAFPGLPSGVTLRDASGTTSGGAPYVNFAPALTRGGLSKNSRSESLLVEFDNPTRVPFALAPQVLAAANRAPTLDPLPPLSVTPGDILRVPLVASDPDGDVVTFSLSATGSASAGLSLPTSTLHADGTLEFTPAPNQLGQYTFDVIATDGALSTRRAATLEVVADPVTTTRLSGVLLKTNQQPLAGVTMEVGPVSAITAADGTFLLDFGAPLPISDTLKIRTELLSGPEEYPFLAEKLAYLLGHEVFQGVNNVITRPIWLPLIDVANGVQIDPMQDVTVTTAAIPGMSVFIKAGTLMNQQGTPFNGLLTITEVPVDLTPAALPEGLFPSLVVTIQPSEMVFTQPAPMTFPNTGGWAPGTLMDLWSINPVFGEFEDVGDMRVSADGAIVETISGGIRNSSWGTNSPPPPPKIASNDGPSCNDCEENGALASEVNFASGAVTETHALPTYQSLGETRGVSLTYDSLRADPRPIFHTGFDDVDPDAISILPDGLLIEARLSVEVNGVFVSAPGWERPEIGFLGGLRGGENFFDIPAGSGPLDAALQIDLSRQPTGVYLSRFSSGIRNRIGDIFVGTTTTTRDLLIHVNSLDSPFGAGWGLDGLLEIVEGPDGSAAIIDGDGSEMLFRPAQRRDFFLQGIFPGNPLDNTVLRYNGLTGELIGPFVASGAGGLLQPHNPTFGPDGNLYVLSGGTRQVLRYDGESGAFMDVFVANGEGGFGGAAELAFDSAGNLYATSGSVLRYDSAGNFIDSIAGAADGVGAACGIEFGPDGNLYVWDTADEEMRRFNPVTGGLIDVFIPSSGNVVNACDFDFGPDGDIFITDATKGGVRRFDGTNGSFLGVFATTASSAASGVTFGPGGDLYVNVNGNTDRFDGETGDFIDRFVPGNGGFGNFGPAPDAADQSRFVSPPGDFSALEKLPDGTYRQTMPDQTVYSFNTLNKLASMTDRNGNTTAYEYDAVGNLSRIIDPVGLATVFAYTAGRVRSITDPANRVTQFEYDGAGDLVRITDADGASRRFGYTDRHLMTEESTKRGFHERTFYDEFGRATRAVLTDNSERTITPRQVRGLYPVGATSDPFNPPPAIRTADGDSIYVDANGNTIGTELDEAGQKVSSRDDIGSLPTIERDPATNLVTQFTDARGNLTTYTYDDRGNVLTIADVISGAAARRFTYDPNFSQLASITDELGRQTLLDIDPANGNVRSVTQVVGSVGGGDDVVSAFTYTAQGLVDTITDSLGRVTDFAYDSLGRVIEIVDARGAADEATMRFEYDAAGNLSALIDENGNRTEFEYDPLNRPMKITEEDPDGAGPLASPVTQFTYDAAGNIETMVDPRNNAFVYEYDERDRMTLQVDPNGDEERFEYDGNSNLTAFLDGNSHKTEYRYDARNRITAMIDPDDGQTLFAYDADDNLISVTDPVGNVTQLEYDVRNRRTKEIDPRNKSTLFGYDLVDNLSQTTDRLGRVTAFAYDDLDRLVTERWLDDVGGVLNEFDYAYDAASNLVSVTDAFSALAFTYDARDRIATFDNLGTPNVPNVVLTYTYDDAGNMLTMSDTIAGAAGGTNAYQYDDLNRLVRLTQSGTNVSDKRVDFTYNPLGQFEMISRFSDLGAAQLVNATTYVYDTLNRLMSLTHNDGTSDVAFFNYAYDAADRITSITDVDGVTTYTYDDRDQLTGADHNDPANPDEAYAYDANGNRVSSHAHGAGYQIGDANRLASDGDFNYEYDANGNLIRRTEIATGVAREFAWDHRNRLTRVVDKNAAQTVLQTVEFTYDALNRRISKSVATAADTVLAHFVYDGANVLLDFVAAAAGPNAPVLAQRYLHGPAVDQVLAQDDGAGGVLWMLTDHLGTVTDLVDSTGAAVNHIQYDSFGNVISESNPAAATRYRFTGREFDAETELYYYRARYYDAALARFLSEDPIGFAAGDPNLYRYVGNTPTGHRDPWGLVGVTQYDLGGFFGGRDRSAPQPPKDPSPRKPGCEGDGEKKEEDERDGREPGGGGGGGGPGGERERRDEEGTGGLDIIYQKRPRGWPRNKRWHFYDHFYFELRPQWNVGERHSPLLNGHEFANFLNRQNGIQGFTIEE